MNKTKEIYIPRGKKHRNAKFSLVSTSHITDRLSGEVYMLDRFGRLWWRLNSSEQKTRSKPFQNSMVCGIVMFGCSEEYSKEGKITSHRNRIGCSHLSIRGVNVDIFAKYEPTKGPLWHIVAYHRVKERKDPCCVRGGVAAGQFEYLCWPMFIYYVYMRVGTDISYEK